MGVELRRGHQRRTKGESQAPLGAEVAAPGGAGGACSACEPDCLHCPPLPSTASSHDAIAWAAGALHWGHLPLRSNALQRSTAMLLLAHSVSGSSSALAPLSPGTGSWISSLSGRQDSDNHEHDQKRIQLPPIRKHFSKFCLWWRPLATSNANAKVTLTLTLTLRALGMNSRPAYLRYGVPPLHLHPLHGAPT